jgi:hypothetical protein
LPPHAAEVGFGVAWDDPVGRGTVFEMMTCNVAVLSIAALYYAWKDRATKAAQKRRQLCDRVAYMLWAAAQRA